MEGAGVWPTLGRPLLPTTGQPLLQEIWSSRSCLPSSCLVRLVRLAQLQAW